VRSLVTGASGFLGRALVSRLRAGGRSVRVLVRQAPDWLTEDPGIEVVVGDLRDGATVERATDGAMTVFHLGAAMTGTAAEHEASTVTGTQHVIDASIRFGTRLIYVSSLAVLDHAGRRSTDVIHEGSPIEPFPERRGVYTQAKLAAELLVVDAIQTRRLRSIILRPGQIFGPGAERTPPNATIVVGGRWMAVGPAAQTLPLVYVDDVVDALMLAERRREIEGRIFHVVDPRSITHAEYLRHCRRKLGDELPTIRVPAQVLEFVAAMNEFVGALRRRPVALTRYRVQSLRPLANFNLQAAMNDLGWEPRIGVKEGLRRTFN
jgi:2-alkyl-3-oxoalkanoate reductase